MLIYKALDTLRPHYLLEHVSLRLSTRPPGISRLCGCRWSPIERPRKLPPGIRLSQCWRQHWNTLLVYVRQAPSLLVFWKCVKAELFSPFDNLIGTCVLIWVLFASNCRFMLWVGYYFLFIAVSARSSALLLDGRNNNIINKFLRSRWAHMWEYSPQIAWSQMVLNLKRTKKTTTTTVIWYNNVIDKSTVLTLNACRMQWLKCSAY